MKEVTDPRLLEQLNASTGREVTDPALLRQLEGNALSPEAQAFRGKAHTAAPGIAEQAIGGAQHAFDRAAMGLRQMVSAPIRNVIDKADDYLPGHRRLTEERLRQGEAFVKETGPASTVGQIGGDMALMTPLAAQAGPKLVGNVLNAAGTAAAFTPGDLKERATAAALGAGGAAAGYGLAQGASRAFSPIRPGPEAQKLLNAGVKPTVGDALAADGSRAAKLVQSVERGIQGTPIVGAPLRGRGERALTAFQKATREAALPPDASKEAAASVDSIAQAFKSAYDDVLTRNPFPVRLVDEWDAQDAARRIARALNLDTKMADEVIRYADEVLDNIDLGGNPTAAAAHHAESVMKKKAFQYKKSLDPDQQAFGTLLQEVANDWGRAWRGTLPDDARNLIGQIDTQYSKFIPVRRSAGLAANSLDPEAYTPKQFLQSIRAGDKNPTKSNFLAGTLPQQDFARVGANLSVPHEPSQLAKFTSGGLATAVATSVIPGKVVGTAIAMMSAGYGTDVVQNYLLSQGVGQRAVAEFMQRAAPLAAQAGRSTMTQQQMLGEAIRTTPLPEKR